MSLKKQLLSLVFLIIVHPIFCQDISGYWQGVLFQEDGIPVSYFPFSLTLTQTDNTIEGNSKIVSSDDDTFFGVISLGGNFDGNTFEFQEIQIIEEVTGDFFWCIKDGDLIYDDNLQQLKGPWKSPGCSPGTIELYRLAVLSDSIFCQNDLVDLEVSGQNVKWYSDANLNNLIETGNSFSPTNPSTTTYFVTQTHYDTESPPVAINIYVDSPVINTIEAKITDCVNSLGSLTVEGIGGTGNLMYSLDGGPFQENNFFSGLVADTYTVTIRDANNCRTTQMTEIQQVTTPIINDIETTFSDCEDNTGSLIIEAIGGTGELVYSVDNLTFQENKSFSDLAAGAYTITVRDANNCKISQMAEIQQLGAPIIDSVNVYTTACGKPTGSIVIFVKDARSDLSYSLNANSPQTSNSFDNLSAGIYTILVSDNANCETNEQIEVADSNPIRVVNIATKDPVCGETNGQIALELSGGKGQLTIQLNNSSSQSDLIFENVGGGSQEVSIEDELGCRLDTLVQLKEENCPIFIPSIFSPNSDGNNDTFQPFLHPNYQGMITDFTIFDRWGNLVFKINAVNSARTSWDGNMNGEELPNGSYLYFIEIELDSGQKEIKTGEITLLR